MTAFFSLKQVSVSKIILWILLIFSFSINSMAQVPVNDNCANAINIPIPNGNFGLGNFISLPTILTNATVQTGETYAPAIFVAGLDKKSVWYRFSIPTIRAVRVTLTQPGTTITAGDAGFAVYQTNTCMPTNANISSKLTPIVTFGNTYHPCVPSGDYLIQVSSKLAANGPITVQLEISDQTGAAYDHPNQAYAFDTVRYYAQKIDFNTECQSIEDSTEICNAFANKTDYNKTAWLTFTTPAYFDYLDIQLSGTGASYYFPSNNNLSIYRKFGYTLYKGNAVNTPIASLQVIDGCDSLESNGIYAGYKVYKCSELQTKTTYSIQIFINKNFGDDIRIGILAGGQKPTNAPQPKLLTVPPPNAIGVLPSSPSGTLSYVTDVWGCNSRHSNSGCGPSLPDSGIAYNGVKFNLSSFITFTLTNTAAIFFNGYVTQCGTQPLLRVFKQGLTNNCADLDTANIIGVFNYNGTIDCLQPGNYTVQVSGQDYTQYYGYFTSGTPTYNSEQCLSNNLGTAFRLDMTAYTRKAANKYSLNAAGSFDSINRVGNSMQALAEGVPYPSQSDTMGCQNTLRPADTTCSPLNNKVMYREFVVADSGIVDFSNLSAAYYSPWRYRLYSGDANALASAQNLFAFPDKITGLVPKTECFDWNTNCTNRTACIIPGTYTFTTMGGDADVGRVDKPTFTFVRTRTIHKSPFTAQNLGSIMDTLGVNGGTIKTDLDPWSCDDNAVAINGYQPAIIGGKPATKAIYRQFYLKEPALVQIINTGYYYCYGMAYGTKTLFYGKATDGLAGLSTVGGQWSAFPYSAGTTAGCNLLPAGWYTVVSYGQGPSYDSVFRSLNLEGRYNSYVSYRDEYNITITPTCPGPKYNRPYKASVNTLTTQPHLIQWGDRVISTPAYPRTDTTYVLPTERFNCIVDTPFSNHPIKSCETNANRVVYYVFKTTQVSFLQINAAGYYAAVYDKDIRTDSSQFSSLKPIQVCNNTAGYIQFCFFQPGTYTLVIFAKDANICQSVSPSIYIDKIGYSRFDYAKNAFDFGVVPPDSAYHYGKTNDVNPLDSGRAPSNDFFYCTTGASISDPADPVCYTSINPNVYNNGPNKPLYDSVFPPSNNVARRNLWYTFVVDQPGYVKVRVQSKTAGREYQQKFSVYQSNVDGSLPFSTVVNTNQVDSTVAQGLRIIGTNQQTWYYCANLNDFVSFYRDPCTSVTNRYYVLVENVNAEPYEGGGTLPNTQTEVAVFIDSVNLVLPKHDHYYQAGDIGTVGVGKFQGDTDNYSCATKDATDPFYYYGNSNNCQKTLWYKFTPTITGNIRYRMKVNGVYKYDYYNIQLFRQVVPGDSTTNGLKIQGYAAVYDYAANAYWAECCVSPGTYYIMLTGCDQLNEYVYPEIELIEAVGDFCGRAVPAVINGPGAITSTLLVNCHTIGTDYGEFGPQLTCPQGANTVDYKSSWFRMDIGGTDTLDVTAYLVENTNAASSDIKYRLMTGDCGAMQEQSCVLDALTQNTYQCLVPGQSYYVQVLTPTTKFSQVVTGTIDLKLSAIAHADTCAPLTNCLASANFTTVFNCNIDDSVKFVNFSTYGTSIAYKWDFGYNGQTSTAVSPSFFYPALPTDQTYTVKLLVSNTNCLQKDSVTRTVVVPGRPYINFGNDLTQCNSTAPILLTATSHSGATYLWQNNSTADTFRVTATGNNEYWVKINYNGCSSIDTVKVLISQLAAKPLQNIILCTDSVSINASRGLGETYKWNTGATTSSIFVSTPGIYWVDIKYFNCTYRDSFNVNNVATAKPLGNDTTLCLSNSGYILHAGITGAVAYTWQNGSVADTFKVTTPGQYTVTINFGNCMVKDTLNITGFPPPVSMVTDTSVCFGQSLTLPWGQTTNIAGIYRDTLRFSGGCDSLVRRVNLSIKTKPDIGKDTIVCLVQNSYPLNATTAGAVSYTWQDGTTNAVYNVTTPGLYWVAVNFGNCSSVDSAIVDVFAAPFTSITDTSICFGSSLTLPWGIVVQNAGSYRDTISSYRGCDSLIRVVNLTIKARPGLGNDTALSICGVNTINLNSIYNTTGLSVNWTIGTVAVANPSSVNQQGIYRLIATNAGGCSDTAVLLLTINPNPVIGNDAVASACPGSFTNLTSFFNTAGLTNSWTTNGSAVNNPTAVSNSGIYQLIATNNFACADTALLTLTISPKPAIGNDTSINICLGSVADLAVVYNTAGLTTDWTLNGNAVNNPAAVSASGVYRVIVTNITGCKDTAHITISFNPKPSLGVDSTIGTCQGIPFDLRNVYNTAGLTVSWSISGIVVNNPSSVNTNGPYQLIATNNFGCSDTAIVNLAVNSKPALGNDTAISRCDGNSINLTTLYPTAGLTANWTVNGVPVTNPLSVNSAGSYQLIANTAAGCKDTARVVFTLRPKPAIGNDSTISTCGGNSINLANIYTTAGLITNWTIGGLSVVNPSSVTTGIYQLTVSNNFGCQDTALVTVSLNPKPNLGNDKSVSICTGSPANLTNQYATSGLNTNWTINGLAVISPGSVTAAGIYQLVATNSFGCLDTALVTVSVNSKPNLGSDKTVTVCSGDNVDLATKFNTNGLISAWTIGGILVPAPSIINNSGLYQLIVTNGSGCTDTAFVAVNFNLTPNLGTDKTRSACSGNSIDLTKEYSTAGLTSTWTIGGNTVSNPTSISGSGIYQLIATNSFSCSDTASVTVIINSNPTVVILNPVPVCIPATADLTVPGVTTGSTSGLNFTYWQNAQASLPYPNAAFAIKGTYFIKGTDNNGCFDIKPVSVTVYPLPIAMAGNDTTICNKSFALLRGSAGNVVQPGVISYLWGPATGLTKRDTSATIATPAGTIAYTLTATVNYGTCALTATDNVLITMQPPVPAFAGNDTTAVSGVPHQLQASGGVNYLWNPDGPLNNAFVANPIATVLQDTKFVVRVTDLAGCVATDTIIIKVYDGISYYVPNAFSPNGDGLNDVFRPIPVGIVSTDWFRIYSRYGTLIFETNKWMHGWDGNFKGQKQPVGNYVWVIKGKGSNGRVIEMKGNVVLVR
ncbi:MAG: gliding motility-associated C-terminal domain-containing protein [Ferruginibacter sp.]|nr:gliding motility-associated C-terminal domain-containing protein [Ferruginibacter sp.]